MVVNCPLCNRKATPTSPTRCGTKRHYCAFCHRQFASDPDQRIGHPPAFRPTCYRCGGTNTRLKGFARHKTTHEPLKGNGRVCYCHDCKKFCRVGGRHELERYHLVLEDRVGQINASEEIKNEVMMTAQLDILSGYYYCWNVPLNVTAAYREIYGEWGQRGSDHPVFRRHNESVVPEV